jgi:Rrf2 family protein
MRVSSKTEYALRTVLDLALNRDDGVVKASEIAQRQSIPLKFLEQILLALRGGGIVESRRGARGGYYLARDAKSISLKDVVRLTEDALLASADTRRAGASARSSVDPFAHVWKRIDGCISSTLTEWTIDDVCRELERQRRQAAQHYAI